MKSVTIIIGLMAAVASCQQARQPSAAECAQGAILAQLINANIADQEQEQASLALVKDALAKNDKVAFGEARNQLLTVVNNGITIRQAAQQIAPKENAANAGLDTVKNAQLTELNLAQNLTGNPATDNNIVSQLEKDFAGGIVQNKKNAEAAVQGCGNQGNKNNNGTANANGGKKKKKGNTGGNANNGNKDANNANKDANKAGDANKANKDANKAAEGNKADKVQPEPRAPPMPRSRRHSRRSV